MKRDYGNSRAKKKNVYAFKKLLKQLIFYNLCYFD